MSEGKIDFRVRGETFQTWYKVVGEITTNSRPLIVLHGGPGVTHSYLLAHTDLSKAYGIPVIFYDQVGNGQSTHILDKPKEFWSVDLFMDELDNLLAHFNIVGNFDLLGHSWGGMLAGSYATQRRPAGLKHLIITDSPASMPLWEESTAKLLKQFPQDMQDTLKKHEEAGTVESQEYQDAMMVFYQKHLCRLDPWPSELVASFAAMAENPIIYQTMQGPSEFTITGLLKNWSIVDDLHVINCPTLVMNSAYDEAQDICVAPFFKEVPKVKWVQYANSSHVPFVEERERYMTIVGEFLIENW